MDTETTLEVLQADVCLHVLQEGIVRKHIARRVRRTHRLQAACGFLGDKAANLAQAGSGSGSHATNESKEITDRQWAGSGSEQSEHLDSKIRIITMQEIINFLHRESWEITGIA